MLDQKIDAIAREKIRIEFEDREGQFGREVGSTVSSFVKRGALHSSGCILSVAEVFQRELKIRAGLALSILRQVCMAIGVQADAKLAPSMKALLTELIGVESDRLLSDMLTTAPIGTSGAIGTAQASFRIDVRGTFEKVRANVLSKAHTEIDLFAAQITVVTRREQAPGNQVTVSGTGNVVLTGAFSGSPMTITIDAESKSEIGRALAVVEDALATLPQPTSFNVAEVRDMVAETKAELAKPQPNSTKLGTMLMGIATTIQTAGAMQPAYAALRSVFAMFGVTLP
jgi:hypothetical protein